MGRENNQSQTTVTYVEQEVFTYEKLRAQSRQDATGVEGITRIEVANLEVLRQKQIQELQEAQQRLEALKKLAEKTRKSSAPEKSDALSLQPSEKASIPSTSPQSSRSL